MRFSLNIPKEEKTSFFLFNLSLAAFFLFLNIFVHGFGGIDEKEEFVIFLHGWLSVPVLTLVAAFVIEGMRKRFFPAVKYFYPTLAAENGLFWFGVVWILRLVGTYSSEAPGFFKGLDAQLPSWQTGEYFFPAPSIYAGALVIAGFIFLNAITIGIYIKCLDRFLGRGLGDRLFLIGLLGFILAALNFSVVQFQKFHLVVMAAVLALLSLLHERLMKWVPGKIGRMVFTIAVLAGMWFLLFDPGFTIDRHHQNFWLGPVVDLMNGKAPLVNIDCQYGVLHLYFLRFMFFIVPFSYQGLNFLVTWLYFVLYTGLYYTLRYLFKSSGFSAFLLLLIIVVNFFATIGETAAFPSIGPLRFGFPYLILWMAVVRLKFPAWRRRGAAIEGLLLAIASAWSFEAFVYSLSAYLALNLYDCAANYSGRPRRQIILERLLVVAIGLIVVHGGLALDVYRRSGEWPHWAYYFQYIFLYSSEGFGSLRISPFSPWVFFVLFPLASLLAIVYKVIGEGNKGLSQEFLVISGLTGLAIGQLTYFLGRSHPNNLFHISIPVIILAAFWILRAAESGRFKRFYLYSGYFALFFIFLNILPTVEEKFKVKTENYANFRDNWIKFVAVRPSNQKVTEGLVLLKKYVPDKSRIAVFMEAEDTTELLVLSGKTLVFPYNQALQANALKPQSARVLNFKHPLKEGDYIFFSKDFSDLQARIVFNLQKEFLFLPKDASPHQIFVVQLIPKQ